MQEINANDLMLIDGGVNLDFVGSAFKTVYDCGKDFGYNVMGAVLKNRR